jgi:hypothetical protein
MGDKDDLSMDNLLDQLRNLTGTRGNVPPIHVEPWDDDMLNPDVKKFRASNWDYDPDPTISEKSNDDIKYKIEVTDEVPDKAPTPLASSNQGSVLRAIEEAMKQSVNKNGTPPLGKIVNLPDDNQGKTVTVVKNTASGVADLKKITLDDLCGYVDSDVDIASAGGEYLVELYRGYELMIKRIIERYPKPSAKNPAEYVDREIFDSISGIMEDDDIAEVVFDLTGEEEFEGGIEAIANLVFNGLNDRFLETSGWANNESVLLINRPVDPTVATSRKPLNVFKDLDLSEKLLPPDISGSMTGKSPISGMKINQMITDFLIDEKNQKL